jgi:hypothetical protein
VLDSAGLDHADVSIVQEKTTFDGLKLQSFSALASEMTEKRGKNGVQKHLSRCSRSTKTEALPNGLRPNPSA